MMTAEEKTQVLKYKRLMTIQLETDQAFPDSQLIAQISFAFTSEKLQLINYYL